MQVTHEELAEFKMTNLERGLAIVELLGQHPSGLGTSEISRLLEIPKNFVFRATAVLHHLGYLERNEDAKTFSLSRKLLSMGYHVLKHTSLVEESMPQMRALRNQVKETVTLCAIQGHEGIVLDHVPSPHALRLAVETGARFHLHASAPGKAMLAFLPADERAELIHQLSFEKFTDQTITKASEFKQALLQIATDGFAIDLGEELIGIHCLSAPILDEKNYPIGALVVTGPASRFQDTDFEQASQSIKEAAKAISVKLGWTATR